MAENRMKALSQCPSCKTGAETPYKADTFYRFRCQKCGHMWSIYPVKLYEFQAKLLSDTEKRKPVDSNRLTALKFLRKQIGYLITQQRVLDGIESSGKRRAKAQERLTDLWRDTVDMAKNVLCMMKEEKENESDVLP